MGVLTSFPTTDPRTQKKWSSDLFEYALKATLYKALGLVGVTPDAFIHTNRDLQKGKGDTVGFELTVPPSGAGQGDDGTYDGNTDTFAVHNDSVVVHQRGNASQSAGLMSEQRTATDFRPTAKTQLGIWLKEKMEFDMRQAICGLYNETGIATVNESYPSAARIWYGGQTSAGVIERVAADANVDSVTTNLFGSAVISTLRRMAIDAVPALRPITIDGKDYFVALIHPLAAKAIKMETNWSAWQKDAALRGATNPLFTAALGIVDGVILVEDPRMPYRTGAGSTTPAEGFSLASGLATTNDAVASGITVARGALMGAQGLLWAWAKSPSWIEAMVDGATKARVTTEAIYGVKRTKFKTAGSVAQQDYGIINFDCAVVADPTV